MMRQDVRSVTNVSVGLGVATNSPLDQDQMFGVFQSTWFGRGVDDT